MTVFNNENKGYVNATYPLFLGPELGLIDTIRVAYPELEDLYQKQVSQIWNENEVSLVQDRQDMLTVPKDTVDLMVKTISWQHLGDSIASRSITGLLLPYVTNSELEMLINAWGFFETIHARTYSHIVKQTFIDPVEALKQTYENTQTLVRSQNIIKAFDSLRYLPANASEADKRKALIETLSALFALEAIAFMGSFAVTFAIAETGVFQGISQLVSLICRDETLHTRFDHAIISILKKDKGWKDSLKASAGSIKKIVDDVVYQELEWADYLFSEGRQVVGLTAELLKEYTLFSAKPVYDTLGIEYDFPVISENPCPYMEKYIDSSKVQVAAQELQITAYKIGAVKDDSDNVDLDFDI